MTKKQNFREEFPNLVLKIPSQNNVPHYSLWTMERLLEDIQKHCLDKQKVLKAIEKFRRKYVRDLKPDKPILDVSYYLDMLKKELEVEK